MKINIEKIGEGFFLSAIFMLIAFLSCSSSPEEGFSFFKYHVQWGSSNLLENYEIYRRSLIDFLIKTSDIHQGNSESGWRTLFYLWPLFIFSDLLGGLDLSKIILFTVISSLLMLIVFYCWLRKFWGKTIAFAGALFLGTSSVFQEFARSGSYDAYSLLIAVCWVCFFYFCITRGSVKDWFVLGLVTGVTWYGYGVLRSLTLAGVLAVFIFKKNQVLKKFLVYLAGLMLILAIGFSSLLYQQRYLVDYKGKTQHLLFDKEGIDRVDIFKRNLIIFAERIMGKSQLLEPGVEDRFHAPFLNPLLLWVFLIGIIRSLLFRRQPAYGALLLAGSIIFLVPLFTSSVGYAEPRRSMLYIIPVYAFIGIGFKEIYDKLYFLFRGIFRLLPGAVLMLLAYQVISSEQAMVTDRILKAKRDVGLIQLSKEIKERKIYDTLLYVEKDSLKYSIWGYKNLIMNPANSIYQFSYESEVLRLLMMENGKSVIRVISVDPAKQISFLEDRFHVVKSPLLEWKVFYEWRNRHKLKYDLVVKSPVTNVGNRRTDAFKFYNVSKIKRSQSKMRVKYER